MGGVQGKMGGALIRLLPAHKSPWCLCERAKAMKNSIAKKSAERFRKA